MFGSAKNRGLNNPKYIGTFPRRRLGAAAAFQDDKACVCVCGGGACV